MQSESLKPKWVNRSVAFNLNDPDEMELFEFSKRLPNFTFLVKEWLVGLRSGGARPIFQPAAPFEPSPVLEPVFSTPPGEEEDVEFDEAQFF